MSQIYREEYELCPYNRSHNILKNRMQTHLVKCRKSYPTADNVTCPFNTTHHVPKPELPLHVKLCPNRSVVDRAYCSFEPRRSNVHSQSPSAAPIPEHVPVPMVSTEEDWDDFTAPVFNPQENALRKNVLVNLIGKTPSERKAFKHAQRRRLQGMEEEGGPSRNPGTIPGLSQDTSVPLRRPKQLPSMGRGMTLN